MFRANTTKQEDYEESVKKKNRELIEEERKKRIFNPRQRTIGLDIPALDRQCFEKKKAKEAEAKCNRMYDEQWHLYNLAAFGEQKRREKDDAEAEKDLFTYRANHQKFEDRREFDLNDPMKNKKQRPLRWADTDIALGASSMQIFDGEDLNGKERSRLQKKQLSDWLEQQMKERKVAEQQLKDVDNLHLGSQFSRNKVLDGIEKSGEDIKKTLLKQNIEINLKLAEEKRQERRLAKIREQQDNQAEIYNMLTSDMLTENPDAAQSRLDPNKKVAYMYRCMTPDEFRKFRDEQDRVAREQQKGHEKDRINQSQWHQYMIDVDNILINKDVELQKMRHQENLTLVEENRKIASMHKNRNVYDRNVRFRNEIKPEFFEQFNKTSR